MKILKLKNTFRYFFCILSTLLMVLTTWNFSSFAASNFKAINLTHSYKDLDSIYQRQNNFGGTLYSFVAFDFHIFAENVELNAHTNGNIAALNLNANGQSFGADEPTYLHKQEDNYIGNSAKNINNIASNGNIVIGNNLKAKLNKQDQRIILDQSQNYLDQTTSKKIYQEAKNSSPYIDIPRELSNLKTLTQIFAQKQTSPSVSFETIDANTKKIQVTKQGGAVFLNLSAADLYNNSKETIHITLPEKTTCIVNVDMKQAPSNALENLVVTLNNYPNSESIASSYCGLLWNLYDSSCNDFCFHPSSYYPVGMSDYFFGTILAPCANITYGALNGSVIAKNVKQGGKESHRFDFTGYEDPENEEDTTTEVTTELTTELTTENTSELTTELTTENTSESTTENTTESTTEITTENTSEATTELTTESTTELTTENTSEATTEITTESTPGLTTENTSEATTELTTEITTETTSELTTESTTGNTSEITTELTTENTSEVTTELTSEYTTESTTSSTTEQSTTGTTTQSTTSQTSTETIIYAHPKTGDSSKLLLISILGITSLGLLLALLLYVHYRKK